MFEINKGIHSPRSLLESAFKTQNKQLNKIVIIKAKIVNILIFGCIS